MMSLAKTPLGKEVKIVQLAVDHKLKQHLGNLGVFVHQTVTPIISNAGNVVIKIRDSRLAISKSVAMKIWVDIEYEEIDNEICTDRESKLRKDDII